MGIVDRVVNRNNFSESVFFSDGENVERAPSSEEKELFHLSRL